MREWAGLARQTGHSQPLQCDEHDAGCVRGLQRHPFTVECRCCCVVNATDHIGTVPALHTGVVQELPVPDHKYEVASAFNDMSLHLFSAAASKPEVFSDSHGVQ